MSDRTDDILDAKNNKIKEQAATIERYERVFRCDRQNERGWIAWAGPTLFRFFTDLGSALEYASEIKGRIYEQMASDSARQICEIEDQSATIAAHEATIKELRLKLAEAGNYTADDSTFAKVIQFGNGRIVQAKLTDGRVHLGVGWTVDALAGGDA